MNILLRKIFSLILCVLCSGTIIAMRPNQKPILQRPVLQEITLPRTPLNYSAGQPTYQPVPSYSDPKKRFTYYPGQWEVIAKDDESTYYHSAIVYTGTFGPVSSHVQIKETISTYQQANGKIVQTTHMDIIPAAPRNFPSS